MLSSATPRLDGPRGKTSTNRSRLLLLLAIGLFLAVVGARWMAIDRFGSDVPFWDQWDTEGDETIRPWIERHELWGPLLKQHAEHRILPTRALNLVLAVSSGQWDARVQCVVNALLVGAIGVILFASISRPLRDGENVFNACMIAVLLGLPLDWENVVGGFQSQFYFLAASSFLAIAGLVARPGGSFGWWGALLAGAVSFVSMGSGFFFAVPVAVVAAIRLLGNGPKRSPAITFAVAIAIIVAGFVLRPHAPWHQSLGAHGVKDFVVYFLQCAAWPKPEWPWLSVVWWTPAVLLLIKTVREKFTEANSAATVAVAITLWTALQMAAVSYARGATGSTPSSRYFILFAIGLTMTAVSLLLVTRDARPLWRVSAVVLWCGALLTGAIVEGRGFVRLELPVRKTILVHYQHNLQAYAITQDRTYLQKEPLHEIPYLSGDLLERFISPPVIQALLPPTLRAPLSLVASPTVSAEFRLGNVAPETAPLPLRRVWGNFRASPRNAVDSWRSDRLPPARYSYWKFEVSGDLGRAGTSLQVVSAKTKTVLQRIVPPRVPENSWRSVIVSAPREPAYLEAEATNTTFAFSEPVEVSRASYLALLILHQSWTITFVGLGVLLFAAGIIAARRFT